MNGIEHRYITYQDSFIGFVKSQSNFIKYFVKDILANVSEKNMSIN